MPVGAMRANGRSNDTVNVKKALATIGEGVSDIQEDVGHLAGAVGDELKVRARAMNIGYDEMRAQAAAANPAGRFGTAEDFGDLCAFVCIARAGSITGQNFLIDGGNYPGTF